MTVEEPPVPNTGPTLADPALADPALADPALADPAPRRVMGRWLPKPRRAEGASILGILADDEREGVDPADLAVNGLSGWRPDLSASITLDRRQGIAAVGLAICVVLALVLAPIGTLIVANALMTIAYIAAVAFRLLLIRRSATAGAVQTVSDDEARSMSIDSLPVYTVLVPLYDEPEVVAQLLAALGALEYPPSKLDIKILVEVGDMRTWTEMARHELGEGIEALPIPDIAPQTKPKACNVGLAVARGELVTIYDAEDVPEPLQLRRAVAAFRRLGPDHACLQARLAFYNPTQNQLTKWFALDYGQWFHELLPGLASLRVPIPLGGTSNHFRTDALVRVKGWDPYNVTEDADLGVRLDRLGGRVGLLDSDTGEEANSDWVNWVRQRSRWYKGYLLSWLVHMRHPIELWRDLGTKGLIAFHLFMAGTPLLAFGNALTWGLTLGWLLSGSDVIKALYPSWMLAASVPLMLIGNFSVIYSGVLTARRIGRPELTGAALLLPGYWVLMALAATKAVIQLVIAPTYWEKTVHGLYDASAEDDADAELVGATS